MTIQLTLPLDLAAITEEALRIVWNDTYVRGVRTTCMNRWSPECIDVSYAFGRDVDTITVRDGLL